MKKIIKFLLETGIGQILLNKLLQKRLEKLREYVIIKIMESKDSFVINYKYKLLKLINEIDIIDFLKQK